ncbi:hypothetical protein BE04_48150 [Sorangium cellulosum]|uniref:Secreted protein n=2 Tax=Sorangium cellulosum TaxID=56 RepID=A0A150PQK3_SORCE|nr:hypothetical protein [Sorangium cellulosum]AGP36640.1 hypothetical protein SCE1572_20355 [Sorangium cellulosum So0157-2]KYF58037.1 hypothetical protein BE04_48150 [Sorangium cellulosum]
MKKSLISFVVLAAATFSTSAMAVKANTDFTLEIDYAFGVSDANSVRCDPSFLIEDDEVLGYPAQFCAHSCKATFEGDLLDSTNVWLWQKMTTGNYDCEELDKDPIVTLVINDPERITKIFFKNEKRKVNKFVGGQDAQGNVWGVCSFKGLGYVNYSCNLLIDDGDDHEYPEEGADETTEPATDG